MVTASFARTLLDTGVNVKVMKPVETGCAPDPVDAILLREAVSERQTLDEICPFRFETPVAPVVAARLEEKKISAAEVKAAVLACAKYADVLLVEGAGGLLVEISDGYSFADLAKEIGAEVLVVVGSRLGALNHAALTFEVLRARKIPVLGYVLNELSGNEDLAVSTNREELVKIAARYEIQEKARIPFLLKPQDELFSTVLTHWSWR